MRRFKYYVAFGMIALLLFSFLPACGSRPAVDAQKGPEDTASQASEAENDEAVVAFKDALGYEVRVKEAKRVVALMGSFAETWLLAGGELVGVTDDAYTERGLSLSEQVTTLGAYKSPSVEKIISLDPDLVILSADTKEHVALYETLKQAGVNPAYFSVNLFPEYLDMLNVLTDITGHKDLYEKNGLAIKEEIQSTLDLSKDEEQPKVLFIRAFSSGYKAKNSDSMVGAMLSELGAINIADHNASLLEDLSIEAIIAADPDYILVVTMGSDSQRALDVLREGLESNPAWKGLKAVKNQNYHVLPKELFHYKPNARWGESYAQLAQILYEY